MGPQRHEPIRPGKETVSVVVDVGPGWLNDGGHRPQPAPAHGQTRGWLHDVTSARAARMAHHVTLAAAAALLIYVNRRQWFFFDEWDFITGTVAGGVNAGVFQPHNEHWSTAPILIYRTLLPIFGLRTYVPYMLVLIAIHLLTAHLLWRWMIRVGADPWVATALAGTFLILGAGAENLTWAFQIGFIGSIACGLAALLLTDRDGAFGLRDMAVWAMLVLSCMFSGIGVEMTLVVALFAWLRRDLRTAIRLAIVPAIAFVAWYALAAHGHLATTPPTRAQILMIPDFAWQGLSGTFSNDLGLTGVGAIITIVLAVFLLRRASVARSLVGAAYALALGAISFYVVTGYGRVSDGLSQATAPRYVYVATALLLVPVAWACTALVRRSLVSRIAVLVVIVFAAGYNGALLVQAAHHDADLKQVDEQRLVAAVEILHSGVTILAGPATRPDPQIAPQLSLATLRILDSRGYLPTLATIDPSNRIAAALALEATVTTSPALPPGTGPSVTSTTGAKIESTSPTGCAQATSSGDTSRIEFAWTAPASLQVTSADGGSLQLWFLADGNPAIAAGPTTTMLGPGQTVTLNVAPTGAVPAISLPAGTDMICGIR